LQKVVGKFDVGLVDLVDQQHGFAFGLKCLPQFALADVVFHIMHTLFAKLAVAQAADGVIFVQTLLRTGGRFDVPFDHGQAKGG